MRRIDDAWVERVAPLAAQAVAAAQGESAEAAEATSLALDALLEAMFLMAVADGEVCDDEVRQFARSCERLMGDVAEGDVEGMFLAWAGALAEEGWERRMRSIAGQVAGTELAELAFRLAVAIAVVDDRLAVEEAEGIEMMASSLGIEPGRAHRIVRELHAELGPPGGG